MSPWLSLLGMARKAGKVEIGEDALREAALSHRARLILLARDAGESTAERVRRLEGEKLPVIETPADRAALGGAVGFASAAALAVTDLSFASAIAARLAQEEPGLAEVSRELAQRQEKARRRKADTLRHGRKSKRKQ
ncbi:MAG: 50S ribosomal protein L7 [Oscillospiraceae bacterium]|nr:50S ribosomal protein L7 [Oscillospiraceae bacterium]